MATRNLVPRATGEGNIGSSSKHWLSAFFDTINIIGAAILYQITTPANPSAGYNKLYFKSDDKLYKLTSGGTESEVGAGGATATRGTFVNGDLSTGKLTVAHTKGLSAPYSVLIQVFDNNYKMVIPDEVTGATNSFEINLSSYGTLSGTWGYVYIA